MGKILKTHFSKTLVSGIAATLLLAGCMPQPGTKSNLSYVDPHIGGMGHLLHPTRPNVQLPNQMIRMHPVRADYLDDQISFFPLTMISHREGELFGIMPYSCSVDDEMWKYRQMYDHDLETVYPYYYSTYLIDSGIQAEFTPGRQAGYFRFTFPAQSNKLLKLQINQGGTWDIISENSVSGEEVFCGMKAYLYGEFNLPGNATLNRQIRVNTRKKTSKTEPVALFEFPTGGDEPLEFKYGISFISAEQARANLDGEIPGWDFGALKDRGKKAWSDKLDPIHVKGGTDAQRRTFYTSLYRCYERMVNINEDGRYYSGYDHQVHESDRDFYVDDWVWDTYRSEHPLMTLVEPEHVNDMIKSIVSKTKHYGWLPAQHHRNVFGQGMVGDHLVPIIVDAYMKGFRDYDVDFIFEAMREKATGLPLLVVCTECHGNKKGK